MSIQVVDRPGGGGGGGQTGDVNLVGVSGAPIALGPAAAGESFPTVLPDSQISALTPPGAITNYAQETGGNLAILAGLVTAARAAVDLITGQVGIDGGAGVVSNKTIRTTMATDSPLPVGTNKIGGVEIRTSGGTTAAEIMDTGSDGISNSFNQIITAGFLHLFNGTTWDRARGSTATGLLVNTSGTPQGSFFMSPTLQISAVVKAAPGTLLSCNGRLDGQADTGQYFLQFYDSATVPSDGPVTILRCETIEHIQNYSTAIDFEYLRGKTASSGISFALSTTEFTKTLATGETYLSLEVEYK